jgi:hypothetical protein
MLGSQLFSQSILKLHNETGNIWTHLVPSILFGSMLIQLLFRLGASRSPSETLDIVTAAASLFGTVLVHVTSTFAHTFANHSIQRRDLMFRWVISGCIRFRGAALEHLDSSRQFAALLLACRLDYAAISYYGFAVGYAVTHFSTVMPWVHGWVDVVLMITGIGSCFLACWSRSLGKIQYTIRYVHMSFAVMCAASS